MDDNTMGDNRELYTKFNLNFDVTYDMMLYRSEHFQHWDLIACLEK